MYYYFLGSDLYFLFLHIKAAFVSFLFIWFRGNTFRFLYDKLSCLAWRRFLPLSLSYLLFLWVLGVSYFLCCSVLMEVCKLLEDLNFCHYVFKTLGLSVDF